MKVNKISNLFESLCPNGVEFRKIWELTIWNVKFKSVEKEKQPRVNKNKKRFLVEEYEKLIVDGGDIKILTTSLSNLYTSSELVSDYIEEGEVVYLPSGGNAIIQYFNGKFITTGNMIATSIDKNILNNKFLYYVLNNRIDEIASFFQGAGIKHPNMSKILDMEIPVPPIKIQNEIVRILDNFTELNVELNARKKQYEYYRQKILTFEDKFERIIQLKNVITYLKNDELKKGEVLEKGSYPVINAGKCIYGYYDKYNNSGNAITISSRGNGAGHVSYIDCDFFAGSLCYPFRSYNEEEVLTKYLYHYLKNKENFIRNNIVNFGSIPALNKKDLDNVDVYIPDISVQKNIVYILDNFDDICTNLNIGLPKEIDLRKKQYEYYRNLLLTFPTSGGGAI